MRDRRLVQGVHGARRARSSRTSPRHCRGSVLVAAGRPSARPDASLLRRDERGAAGTVRRRDAERGAVANGRGGRRGSDPRARRSGAAPQRHLSHTRAPSAGPAEARRARAGRMLAASASTTAPALSARSALHWRMPFARSATRCRRVCGALHPFAGDAPAAFCSPSGRGSRSQLHARGMPCVWIGTADELDELRGRSRIRAATTPTSSAMARCCQYRRGAVSRDVLRRPRFGAAAHGRGFRRAGRRRVRARTTRAHLSAGRRPVANAASPDARRITATMIVREIEELEVFPGR